MCPVFAPMSRKKSNIAWVNMTSCGEVRKNHFSPRWLRLGDELSADMYGTS